MERLVLSNTFLVGWLSVALGIDAVLLATTIGNPGYTPEPQSYLVISDNTQYESCNFHLSSPPLILMGTYKVLAQYICVYIFSLFFFNEEKMFSVF
jgi:hypothetical protein